MPAPNRVLFLDIDGVINSSDFLNRPERDEDADKPGRDHQLLDPKAMAELNRILAVTGAKVVISSVWRYDHTVEQLQTCFEKVGFKGEIIGLTPQRADMRGREIEEWLDTHPGVERFVIIDDDIADMEPMTRYLIKTTFKHGLLSTHADMAIRRLR